MCILPSSGVDVAPHHEHFQHFQQAYFKILNLQVCYQNQWLMTFVRVELQRPKASPMPLSTSGVCCANQDYYSRICNRYSIIMSAPL